jgi:peroxiredoxin
MTAPDARRIFDWRRLLLALPVLAVLAAVTYLVVREDAGDTSTPQARLLDTDPVAGADAGVIKGRTARDFTAAAPGGEPLALSDFRGRAVVLNFWATWCTSCLAEMPDLKSVQQEFGAYRVAVLALNSGESAPDTEEFIEQLDAPDFTYAFDPSLAVTDAYGIVGLSHTVFVDADGVIRATYVGQMTPDLMREYIRAALDATDAEEPPFRLRLPGAVEARTSVFTVSEVDDRTVRISSRRLRCDDSFCAVPAFGLLASAEGIVSVEHEGDADPPAVVVRFDEGELSHDEVAERLAQEVARLGDPLYEHAITFEEAD